jgi:hypothetical protein
MSESTGTGTVLPAINPHLAAELVVDGEKWPVFVRLLPARGHTGGHQVVVVETDAGRNVLGGDVGTSFNELGSGTTEGQRRVLALAAPTWLTHADGGPKVPRPDWATTRAGARPGDVPLAEGHVLRVGPLVR